MKLDSDNNYNAEDRRIKNVATPTSNKDAINKAYFETSLLSHHTNTGNVDLQNKYEISNFIDATNAKDLVTESQLDAHTPDLSNYLKKDGSVKLTGNWTINTISSSDRKEIFTHHDPTHDNALCRRAYVNNYVTGRLRPYLKKMGLNH